MDAPDTEIAVIGAGIVGLAAARSIASRTRSSPTVVEAENRVATHQTGHNSGVVHSGLYYRPGSSKALYCIDGREAIRRFCERNGIPHECCGKVVVATSREQLPALDELERRGTANGLQGLERLDPAGLERVEPHVRGVAALRVPQTGIVDFTRVARAMAAELSTRGGSLLTGWRVRRVERLSDRFRLSSDGASLTCRHLVNCAGLQSDRVARMCGVRPGLRIVPFRGEYYRLRPGRERLIRHLVYPVPDPRFPFLGVHFTRMIDGGVTAGPNAVLALDRNGYSRGSFSLRDALSIASYGGFWRLAARHWRAGLDEFRRSSSRPAFVGALRRLVPQLSPDDVEPHTAGVRAQAVAPDGRLLDDFHIIERERMLHVLNAPSPAATASLSIGEALAERAARAFGLEHR
ncbi:MAG TPA: L-2-hydroxyglutarate oxidase [Candidatus Polarisedimenticolaceae bacterium]|nr:L-2-hydroxyglutarate oxidase [Candidatus Polarisedimenticolaceae bacterium]